MSAELRAALARYDEAVRTKPEHHKSCEYLRRMPPRQSDCDCSAFEDHELDVEDAAEGLVEVVRAHLGHQSRLRGN